MTPLPPVRAWPRRAAARVLAPGRAVAGWRLSVTREARRLGRLGRYAEWIRGLTGAPPSLRADEPLGALADVLERSAERAAARHHGPWRRPTDGVGERAESRGRRGSPGERVRGTPATLFPPAATPAAVRARAVQPRAARLRR